MPVPEPTQAPAQVISEAVREWRLEDGVTVAEAVLAALDGAGWVVVEKRVAETAADQARRVNEYYVRLRAQGYISVNGAG